MWLGVPLRISIFIIILCIGLGSLFYRIEQPDRAHVSITRFEIPYPFSVGKQPAINIVFRNHGQAGADVYGHYESFLRNIPTQEEQKIKLEDGLFTRMQDTTQFKMQFQKVLPYQVPSDDAERFTTTFGPFLKDNDLQDTKTGSLALYVMGMLRYTDGAGCREINYCLYTQDHGKPYLVVIITTMTCCVTRTKQPLYSRL